MSRSNRFVVQDVNELAVVQNGHVIPGVESAILAPPAPGEPPIVNEPRIIRPGQSPKGGLPPILDAAKWISQEHKKPAELVHGLLHQGSKLVIGGAAKTNKTWTLINLAVSVATGTPFWNLPTAQGKVVFINMEVQAAFFADRLRAVCQALGVDLRPQMLGIWNLRGHAEDISTMADKFIKSLKPSKPALVVCDPVYKLSAGRDENSAHATADLLNHFERIAVETGAALAISAHYSKGNQSAKNAVDRISGSGVMSRDPDSILTVTAHAEEHCFTIESTLRNFKPQPAFVVRWDHPLMRLAPDLDPAKLKQPANGTAPKATVSEVVNLLAPESLSYSDWRDQAMAKFNISESTFKIRRREAERRNLAIHQKSNDKYARITQVGQCEGQGQTL
jgi:hypothetical protein